MSSKNPFGGITDALIGTVDDSKPHWNPADYKERPRVNCIPCLACKSDKSGCRACIDVCPVNAIEIEDGAIDVLDSCRKWPVRGIVSHGGVCSPRLQPKKVYDAVARAATAHRRPTSPVRVPSSASRARTKSWWRASATSRTRRLVLHPHGLPHDVTSTCRSITHRLSKRRRARRCSARPSRLPRSGPVVAWVFEVDPKDLVCNKRREYERQGVRRQHRAPDGSDGVQLTPATAAVATVTQRIREHSSRVSALERTLNAACGTTTQKRRRVLTQGRQLVLLDAAATFRLGRERARAASRMRPRQVHHVRRFVAACPVFACDLTANGKFTVEPTYCIGSACAPRCAATVRSRWSSATVPTWSCPNPEAERKAKLAAEAKAEYAEAKAEVKKARQGA